MTLTPLQTLAIIGTAIAGTMFTRFLPFFLFRKAKSNHPYITDLGRLLPYAVIGMLVVYCLRNVRFDSPTHGLPEGIAIVSIVILHYWKENTLLSIGVGTGLYMVLIQTVFA
ncbi:branched-chain amino acid transporter permease [Alkalibacter rhizosphaerae]|uniref:Branched-chain amino acid transporter permease n=1 Tax=Alkalibacter rhizosphaerae TaxID=2815577 RepID=A0A974XE99_9FIRM|nr:branched-chain amino acid transporter permease [Alkalibacter rhizosphaerae]QSX08262.1 branched-chain amino acid transporter permease [Alkalibacter rhizosphaerae]